MFYINENILCKTVHVEGLPDDCEVTLIQLSTHKMKNISLTLLALISTLLLRTRIVKFL